MNVSGKDDALALFTNWLESRSEVHGVLEVASTPEDSPLLEFRGSVSSISPFGVLIRGLSASGDTSFEFTLRIHAFGVEFSARDAFDATREVFAGRLSTHVLVVELPNVWRCFLFEAGT